MLILTTYPVIHSIHNINSYLEQNQKANVFGIQLSQRYPKVLEYDITPTDSEYSWEKTFRERYSIPKQSKLIKYSKTDYYISAFCHHKQYTLRQLIKYNGINKVIDHIDDLKDTEKEFLKLQLC